MVWASTPECSTVEVCTQVPSDLHSHLVHMCGSGLELRLPHPCKSWAWQGTPATQHWGQRTADPRRSPASHSSQNNEVQRKHLSQKLKWQRGLRASQRQAFAFTRTHAHTNGPTACWQEVFGLSVRKHSKSLYGEGTKGLYFLVLREEGLLRAGGGWVTSFLPLSFLRSSPASCHPPCGTSCPSSLALQWVSFSFFSLFSFLSPC